MAKRKDYLRNIKSKHPAGCAWCGAEIKPPVTNMSTCSDLCTQLLFEGIDDQPPVMILQPGNGPNSAYIARKFAEYNEDYGGPA